MIGDAQNLKAHIKELLRIDDGLWIQSEGTVYVRSLEGNNYAAGIMSDGGDIEDEIVFGCDIDGAINFFVLEREKRNHGRV